MKVVLPDGSELELPDGATGLDAARAIGPKLAEQAVLVRSNGSTQDLRLPLADGQRIQILTVRDTHDPDALFVTGAAQNRAKAVCMGCPVRTECLSDALDNRVEFGVWGGMTERERRALLRRRPDVTSWRRLLDSARAEHARQAV